MHYDYPYNVNNFYSYKGKKCLYYSCSRFIFFLTRNLFSIAQFPKTSKFYEDQVTWLSICFIHLPTIKSAQPCASTYSTENVGILIEINLESINYMKKFNNPTFNTI